MSKVHDSLDSIASQYRLLMQYRCFLSDSLTSLRLSEDSTSGSVALRLWNEQDMSQLIITVRTISNVMTEFTETALLLFSLLCAVVHVYLLLCSVTNVQSQSISPE